MPDYVLPYRRHLVLVRLLLHFACCWSLPFCCPISVLFPLVPSWFSSLMLPSPPSPPVGGEAGIMGVEGNGPVDSPPLPVGISNWLHWHSFLLWCDIRLRCFGLTRLIFILRLDLPVGFACLLRRCRADRGDGLLCLQGSTRLAQRLRHCRCAFDRDLYLGSFIRLLHNLRNDVFVVAICVSAITLIG